MMGHVQIPMGLVISIDMLADAREEIDGTLATRTQSLGPVLPSSCPSQSVYISIQRQPGI